MSQMQPTSLRAFFDLVLPKLPECQQKVMDVFYKEPYEDHTNMEIAAKLKWSINRVTPRVLELRKKNILKLSKRRICKVTKNGAYAWKLIK